MLPKADVWKGTLALMILRTLAKFLAQEGTSSPW